MLAEAFWLEMFWDLSQKAQLVLINAFLIGCANCILVSKFVLSRINIS